MPFRVNVLKGDTDVSVPCKVIDSADGTPETGVAYDTAGASLWYRRAGAAVVTMTLASVTAAQAHSDGGFVHLAHGRCRLDLPDAAVASGVGYTEYGGAFTGMIVIGGLVQLTGVDPTEAIPPAAIKVIVTTTVTGDGGTTPWGPAA